MRVMGKVYCGAAGALYDYVCLDAFPPVVRIETTNRCNARCSICPREKMTRPVGTMSEELYRSLIDECAASGCRKVELHNFGEPLLDPALPERIAYAKGKGIQRVKFFTNGSLLSGDPASRLLESGVDEIKISIDGADQEEFESIRVGLNYDGVIENVRSFVNLRDQREGSLPRVVVTCCSTSDRKKTEDALKDVVDSFEFVELHSWTDREAPGRWPIRKACWRLWGSMTVLWNGDVVPCCMDFDGKIVLGDVKTAGSIAAVWKSDAYRRMRRLHRSAEQAEIDICRHCSKSFV